MAGILAQRAYEHIREKLLRGEFEPGTRLRYEPVGKQIGVSATPVREAMGRLASEGLVEFLPGQGAVVREPSRREFCEMFESREVLECYLVAKVCGNLRKSDLARMAECRAEMLALVEASVVVDRPDGIRLWQFRHPEENDRWSRADTMFHSIPLQGAGNRYLHGAAKDTELVIRSLIRGSKHESTVQPRLVCQEHGQILAALERGDAEQARRAVALHIRNARVATLAAYCDGSESQDRVTTPEAVRVADSFGLQVQYSPHHHGDKPI